jgi:uncharacterized membrane protein
MKLLRLLPVMFALLFNLQLAAVPLAHAADCPDGSVKVSTALSLDNKDGNECIGSKDQNPIFALLSIGIKFFSIIFGLLLVLILVIAGIQYITAGGSSDATKEAKDRIKAAITGLVLYVLMFAILQIILPPDQRIFR